MNMDDWDNFDEAHGLLQDALCVLNKVPNASLYLAWSSFLPSINSERSDRAAGHAIDKR